MIRQATPSDARHLALLIVLAMGDLAAKFINSNDTAEAIHVFEKFAGLQANQYSYQNALVYEDETGICGMITAYDGATLDDLRKPFLQYIKLTYGTAIHPEDETQPGEYYIDCLGVYPHQQGKGIGKKLIAALCQKAAAEGYTIVGLLVSKENNGAEKLYAGLGFSIVQEKELLGHSYYHMQRIM
ncbi:Ribosomal protein S18 acetylase RimI [Mucilaginibacter pineti]|uniref:Ribosomal protein S18 acetylase RimI n=1 Tax=Mucilaginibacter pineti TaxID=1391627 RepID=A0A1G6X897_9SPHI|nr:GNAT family N-acetyltransferase [Mucilaginibacter pineti]SDD74344.1 Ribosomal protein S18 acetylase RimI [Mucilaginibacter pineti]